jgi:hypothetical protein
MSQGCVLTEQGCLSTAGVRGAQSDRPSETVLRQSDSSGIAYFIPCVSSRGLSGPAQPHEKHSNKKRPEAEAHA